MMHSGRNSYIDLMASLKVQSLLELVTTPQTPSDHDYHPFQDLTSNYTVFDTENLQQSLLAVALENPASVGTLQLSYYKKGERVGYLALEESNRRTALGLMSAAVGKSLHLGEPAHEELTDAFDKTAHWNLYLFDGFGPMILMSFIIGLSTWHQVSTVESFSWITSPSSYLGLMATKDE